MAHSRPLFSLFSSFHRLTVVYLYFHYKILPLTGFELRTSAIGSNRSANWATTTAQQFGSSISKAIALPTVQKLGRKSRIRIGCNISAREVKYTVTALLLDLKYFMMPVEKDTCKSIFDLFSYNPQSYPNGFHEGSPMLMDPHPRQQHAGLHHAVIWLQQA